MQADLDYLGQSSLGFRAVGLLLSRMHYGSCSKSTLACGILGFRRDRGPGCLALLGAFLGFLRAFSCFFNYYPSVDLERSSNP